MFRYVIIHVGATPSSLHLRQSSFSNPPSFHLRHSSFYNSSVASPTSQALHPRHLASRFAYVTAHSPTLPSLRLHHSSFSNPSVASPTSQLILQPSVALLTPQLILQPFRCFTYVTAHSPTLLSLLLRHRFFTYVTWRAASPTSQLILQPFRRFTYVTAHSPTIPLLHLRHSSFSNPSFASPTPPMETRTGKVIFLVLSYTDNSLEKISRVWIVLQEFTVT